MRASFAVLCFYASLCAAQDSSTNLKPQAAPATLYCTDEYDRRVLVDIDVPTTGFSLRTTPDKAFAVSIKIISPKQSEIRLRALKQGHGTLELCGLTRDTQGQPVGPEAVVMRRWDLQVIELNSNIFETISPVATLPDGSDVFGGELTLSPHVPGIDIRFICLNSKVTVGDGLGERWYASETFTRIPSTGNSMISFRMVRPKNVQWVPFTALLYQNGEQLEAP